MRGEIVADTVGRVVLATFSAMGAIWMGWSGVGGLVWSGLVTGNDHGNFCSVGWLCGRSSGWCVVDWLRWIRSAQTWFMRISEVGSACVWCAAKIALTKGGVASAHLVAARWGGLPSLFQVSHLFFRDGFFYFFFIFLDGLGGIREVGG